MSFLSRLFGRAPSEKAVAPAQTEEQEYKGFRIVAAPLAERGEFHVCGSISRDVGGAVRTHQFRRSDRFSSRDDTVEITFSKARRMIDEMGDGLFDDWNGAPGRS